VQLLYLRFHLMRPYSTIVSTSIH